MTTLFTINKSWYKQAWLFEQSAFAKAGDSILLIEDAVLSLQSPVALASFTARCQAKGIDLYAHAADCQMRGIDNPYPQITLINESEFVDLLIKHKKQVAW